VHRPSQHSVAIYALLSASYLTVADGISRPLSFVWFAVVFAAVTLWIWRDGSLTIAFHPTILAGALLVWFALVVGFLGSPSASGFLRLGAFVGISGVLLFVFPNTFTSTGVYRAVAWVGASLVVVSLPTTVVGEFGPLGIWTTGTLFGVQYFIPTSVFDNPNMLGAIAAMGTIGAAGGLLTAQTTPEGRDRRTPTYDGVILGALAGICALGVVLSTGRAALLALVAGVGVLLFTRWFGRNVTAAVTIVGGIVFVGALGVAARLLPGPELLQSIELSGREVLWRAVVRAVGERPLFGWGPSADGQALAEFVPSDSRYVGYNPHSSYFRMFFIGGLIGGIGYLILCLSALRTALADATPHGITTAAMVVSVFLLLVFNGATLFGLHPVSVVGALTVGFAQLGSGTAKSIHIPHTLSFKNLSSSVKQYIS
jgi:O-antigen ligase